MDLYWDCKYAQVIIPNNQTIWCDTSCSYSQVTVKYYHQCSSLRAEVLKGDHEQPQVTCNGTYYYYLEVMMEIMWVWVSWGKALWLLFPYPYYLLSVLTWYHFFWSLTFSWTPWHIFLPKLCQAHSCFGSIRFAFFFWPGWLLSQTLF